MRSMPGVAPSLVTANTSRLKTVGAVIVFGLGLAMSDAELSAQTTCYAVARNEAGQEMPGRSDQFVPKTVAAIRTRVMELLVQVEGRSDARDRALGYCTIAELMKRVGDLRAPTLYQRAIRADPDEADYNLLFGDYLRTFRGPEQPLFGEASEQYDEALGKSTRVASTRALIERSLVALYERDGLPLFRRLDHPGTRIFLSSQNSVGKLVNDIGESDEIRDFTSEALFAGSSDRLNRPLSRDESAALARYGERGDTLNRLRVRLGNWPSVDAFVGYRGLANRQITNFFQPGRFNDVAITTFGTSVAKPINGGSAFDVLLEGGLWRTSRRGLIEFLPDATEEVTSLIGRTVASRFVGPDKVNFEFTVVSDHIDQHVASPIERGAIVIAPTFRYQLYRRTFGGSPFDRPIAPRGSEFFGGTSYRRETFATSDIVQRDYFGGISFKGLSGLGEGQSFDITVQPTLFTSERRGTGPAPGIETLDNAQYCTFVTWLYRAIDRENERDITHLPPLVFLNVVVTGGLGAAVRGPKEFGMLKVGAGIDAKLVSRALQGGTTFLVSAKWGIERYPELQRQVHQVLLNVSMGF